MAKRDNWKNWLLIGGVGYLLVKYLGGYAYQNISFGMPKVRFGQPNLNGINATLSMPITNKTAVSIPIDSIIGSVLYSGQPIAQFSQIQPFQIPDGKTTTVEIGVYIPFQGAAQSLVNIIASGNFSTYAVLKGTVRSAGVNIPFEQSVSPI